MKLRHGRLQEAAAAAERRKSKTPKMEWGHVSTGFMMLVSNATTCQNCLTRLSFSLSLSSFFVVGSNISSILSRWSSKYECGLIDVGTNEADSRNL